MTKPTTAALLGLGMLAAFLAGTRLHPGQGASAPGARRVLYYVDPMHPTYRSDAPGTAPDCGMALEPVYADAGAGSPPGAGGVVAFAPAKQQLFGVRVAPVETSPASFTLRLFGRVAADETRIYRLNAGIGGYIHEVSGVGTGTQVRKDQVLATFSAPHATMTIQTYILNLGAEDRFQKSATEGTVEAQSLPATAANIQQRTQQLRDLGISTSQLEQIKRSREIPSEIKIVSPADGIVLARNVSPGLKFERGTEFFQIADLTRVWILADVPAADIAHLHPGDTVQVSLPGEHRTLPATVGDAPPQFDGTTRTRKVRLEASNPGQLLRPGMFVDVEVPVTLPPGLFVPAGAVLDSGSQQAVFVEREAGLFAARPVKVGMRFDDRVEILDGLAPGDRIVVSGTFLLDSERRIKLAAGEP